MKKQENAAKRLGVVFLGIFFFILGVMAASPAVVHTAMYFDNGPELVVRAVAETVADNPVKTVRVSRILSDLGFNDAAAEFAARGSTAKAFPFIYHDPRECRPTAAARFVAWSYNPTTTYACVELYESQADFLARGPSNGMIGGYCHPIKPTTRVTLQPAMVIATGKTIMIPDDTLVPTYASAWQTVYTTAPNHCDVRLNVNEDENEFGLSFKRLKKADAYIQGVFNRRVLMVRVVALLCAALIFLGAFQRARRFRRWMPVFFPDKNPWLLSWGAWLSGDTVKNVRERAEHVLAERAKHEAEKRSMRNTASILNLATKIEPLLAVGNQNGARSMIAVATRYNDLLARAAGLVDAALVNDCKQLLGNLSVENMDNTTDELALRSRIERAERHRLLLRRAGAVDATEEVSRLLANDEDHKADGVLRAKEHAKDQERQRNQWVLILTERTEALKRDPTGVRVTDLYEKLAEMRTAKHRRGEDGWHSIGHRLEGLLEGREKEAQRAHARRTRDRHLRSEMTEE